EAPRRIRTLLQLALDGARAGGVPRVQEIVMREVYLVLVEYGQKNEQAALDLLIPMLKRVLPDHALNVVVVDNALDSDVAQGFLTAEALAKAVSPAFAALKGCATSVGSGANVGS